MFRGRSSPIFSSLLSVSFSPFITVRLPYDNAPLNGQTCNDPNIFELQYPWFQSVENGSDIECRLVAEKQEGSGTSIINNTVPSVPNTLDEAFISPNLAFLDLN